ncbi:hypothetical protein AAHC03_024457 [Spirometra sp. Aus1]
MQSFVSTTQFLLLLRLGPNAAFRQARITCSVSKFLPGPFVARIRLVVVFVWSTPISVTSSTDLVGQLIAGAQSSSMNETHLLDLSSLHAVGEYCCPVHSTLLL